LSSSSSSIKDETELDSSFRTSQLLAQYYRIKGTECSDKVTSNDLDSPDFNPNSYIVSLLSTLKQEELLRRDDAMAREVKKLGSDMQMLVYENYNKFIAATDTIRSMKHNVESMENDMVCLSRSVGKIDLTSGKINDSLAENRGRVDTLVRVRRLLKRLEFLFELPENLRASVERGQFSKAVKFYAVSKEILAKHRSVSSFGDILNESEEIISNLRIKLQVRVDSPGLAQAPFVETVSLLLKLGVSALSLRDRFIAFHETLFSDWLKNCENETVRNSAIGFESALMHLAQGFLPLLLRTAQVYKRLFKCEEEKKELHFASILKEKLLERYVGKFFCLLRFKSKEAIENNIWASSISGREGCGETQSEGALDRLACLQQFLFDAKSFDLRLPEVELKLKAEKFVDDVKANFIENRFDSALGESVDVFEHFMAKVSDPSNVARLEGVRGTFKKHTGYQQLAHDALNSVSKVFELCLDDLACFFKLSGEKSLFDSEVKLGECIYKYSYDAVLWLVFSLNCLTGLSEAECAYLEILPFGENDFASKTKRNSILKENFEGTGFAEAKGKLKVSQNVTNRSILGSAFLIREMGAVLVPRVLGMLVRHISQDLTMKLEECVRDRIKGDAERMLQFYIDSLGWNVVERLRLSVLEGKWLREGTIDSLASPAASQVIKSIGQFSPEIALFLGDPLRASAIGFSHRKGEARRTNVGARKGLQLDIDRIFSQESDGAEKGIEFSSDAVMGGVFKVVFSAALEFVRDMTLGERDYINIQLDIELWRQGMCYFVLDGKTLTELGHFIEQIMLTAKARSIEDYVGEDQNELAEMALKELSSLLR